MEKDKEEIKVEAIECLADAIDAETLEDKNWWITSALREVSKL